MNYSAVVYDDIANGVGIRTSLFVSGCRNNCPGCFNKEAQDFNYGKPFTQEVADDIIKSVEKEYYAGITILGGEPLDDRNLHDVEKFIVYFHNHYKDSKTIWLYSGYTYEALLDRICKSSSISIPLYTILSLIDVLVDGPFIESQKDLTLKFRGSANQRLIDMKKTRRFEKIETIE